MSFRSNAREPGVPEPSRRRFMQGLAAGGAVLALGTRGTVFAAGVPRMPELRGTAFDLVVGETAVDYTGRVRPAVTINGALPAPTLRWRQGTTVTLRVRNALPPVSSGRMRPSSHCNFHSPFSREKRATMSRWISPTSAVWYVTRYATSAE